MHQTTINLSDIILGIIYYFPEGDKTFVHKDKEIRDFFNKQKSKYPLILNNIMSNGSAPILEQLREAYIFLRQMEQIRGQAMDWSPICFSQGAGLYFEDNVRSKFNRRELKQLEELSISFYTDFAI